MKFHAVDCIGSVAPRPSNEYQPQAIPAIAINTAPSGIALLINLLDMAGAPLIGDMISYKFWLEFRQFRYEKSFLYYWVKITMAPLYMLTG